MRITRTRGDTYADQFLITDKNTQLPVNLSGCTFKLTLSESSTPDADTAPIYQLAGVIHDPTLGMVEFAPTPTQADQVGSFFYDVQMTDEDGAIRTLVLNSYVYTQDITK